jgi:hypothetical protein
MADEPLYPPQWAPPHVRDVNAFEASVHDFIASLTDAELNQLLERTRPKGDR